MKVRFAMTVYFVQRTMGAMEKEAANQVNHSSAALRWVDVRRHCVARSKESVCCTPLTMARRATLTMMGALKKTVAKVASVFRGPSPTAVAKVVDVWLAFVRVSTKISTSVFPHQRPRDWDATMACFVPWMRSAMALVPVEAVSHGIVKQRRAVTVRVAIAMKLVGNAIRSTSWMERPATMVRHVR